MRETLRQINHVLLAALLLISMVAVVIAIIEKGLNHDQNRKPQRETREKKVAWVSTRQDLLDGEAENLPA